MLTYAEKQRFLSCFDFRNLNDREQAEMNHLLLNYFDRFPILNMLARDVMRHHAQILLKIKKCEDGVAGYQSGREIGFDEKHWKKYIKRKLPDELASTLWHEIVHYIQEKELSSSWSKRGKMVYRQFIEAEAMSYSNLIAPRSAFEAKLYKAILNQSASLEAAQTKYIAVSTRLRLNADRELAKIDARNIMRDYFLDADWQISEKTVLKDWQDFYYKYHADVIKSGFLTKGFDDSRLIKRWEEYFFNRYGLNISVKSAISKEVIDRYTLPKGIENTVLIRTSSSEVFDFSKWRTLSGVNGGKFYVLDMPNMNPDYVKDVFSILLCEGLKGRIDFIRHHDNFSSRCIVLDNTSENNYRFLSLCKKYGYNHGKIFPPEKVDEYPPVNQRDCKYNQILSKGNDVVIDIYNMPVLSMGENFATRLDLSEVLTSERLKFINQGGVIVVGRNPHSKSILIPHELIGKQVKGITIDGAPDSVSKFHGYFYMKNGYICYRDYSTNGSCIRPSNAYHRAQMELASGRN